MQLLLDSKENCEKQYEDYCRKVYEHSILNKDLINALVQIVSIFEGENYEYLKIKRFPRISESHGASVTAHVIALENTLSVNEIYDVREIDKLLKERKIVILESYPSFYLKTKYNYKIDEIQYYKWERLNGLILQENISFEKFSYLKEFIEIVINYKINNEKLEITPNEIEILIYNFITANESKINAIYQTIKKDEDQEISLIQSKNTARHKRLSRVLDKKGK